MRPLWYPFPQKGRDEMKRTKLRERKLPDYTKGEEIMNMVTHIVGGAIGILALLLCLGRSIWKGSLCGRWWYCRLL